MSNTILGYYKSQAENAAAEIKQTDRKINTYSFLRLLAIIAGIFIIYKILQFEIIWLAEVTILFVILFFAFLVKQQGFYEKRKAFYLALKAVNENEIGSILNQTNIYSNGAAYEDDAHNYSSDLDIFGNASLFNLTNRCASPLGEEKLAEWLAAPSVEGVILRRQEAVKEWASKPDLAQKVKAVLLFSKGSDRKGVQNLFDYFKSPQYVSTKALRFYIKITPYLVLTSAALAWYFPAMNILLGILVLTNAFLVIKNQPRVNRADFMLNKVGKVLKAYADAFRLIEKEPWESKLCLDLKNQFGPDSHHLFSSQLKDLSTLLGRLEYRLNFIVSLFINAIAAWDVRQLIAIDDWKERNKEFVPKAFDALASFESLISLSNLHLNNPEWCFPEIAKGDHYTYTATSVAHPLISSDQCVSNNFLLENTHKIDIVTGSNMAGKSTFLRTIGINAVLAFAGAPVCAKSMNISVMNFFAYMRIRDSLNESISTFKAELNRLKLLFDVLESDGKVFFLIDEMLRGTNSYDKYRGSKAVIEKLVSKNAVGIVATHDLQLATLEKKYPDYVRNFYFDIQVVDGEMFFDYKLKAGECKTFNASILLKQIGIEVETEN